MNTIELEKVGLRLIGAFFFFRNFWNVGTALQFFWYKDPGAMAILGDQVELSFLGSVITNAVLALVIALLSIFAMMRPERIQSLWRKEDICEIEKKEGPFLFDPAFPYRVAGLVVGIIYLEKSISSIVQIVTVENIRFAGYNAVSAIGQFAALGASVVLVCHPELFTRAKKGDSKETVDEFSPGRIN